jgi:hypothetical protein
MKKIIEAKYTKVRFDEQVMTAEDIGFECSPAKVSLIPQRQWRYPYADSRKDLSHRRSTLSLPVAEHHEHDAKRRR